MPLAMTGRTTPRSRQQPWTHGRQKLFQLSPPGPLSARARLDGRVGSHASHGAVSSMWCHWTRQQPTRVMVLVTCATVSLHTHTAQVSGCTHTLAHQFVLHPY